MGTAGDTRPAAPTSDALLHQRWTRRVARPVRERSFTYARYRSFLERVIRSGADVQALRAFAGAPEAKVVVGLRHDIDERIESALAIARMEHELGLSATYFVLHTAPYYAHLRDNRAHRNPRVLDSLRRLQALGHEVGWHNDLVTLECVHGIDARRYLEDELAWLRANGIDVVGTAPHGSYWCHVLGYTNSYFFRETSELDPAFPNREVVHVKGRPCRVPRASLADFGLDYDAHALASDVDLYRSDAFVDGRARRWHPDALDAADLLDCSRVIVSTHPCLWDRSAVGKAFRIARRGIAVRRRVP